MIQGIATDLGCSFERTQCFADSEPPACADEVETWIACVAEDTSQCLCEQGDESLNCEGSYKPDEGPAKCIAEYEAAEQCMDAS